LTSIPGSEALSTRELWSLAVGILMPLLIAVPMQPGWPRWGRAVFGLGCCLVAAVVTAYFDGALSASGSDAVARSALMLLIAAWSSYVALWKPTVAPAIETATALGKA
jgi:hypothetical protein